jgi:hypothetical protein
VVNEIGVEGAPVKIIFDTPTPTPTHSHTPTDIKSLAIKGSLAYSQGRYEDAIHHLAGDLGVRAGAASGY